MWRLTSVTVGTAHETYTYEGSHLSAVDYDGGEYPSGSAYRYTADQITTISFRSTFPAHGFDAETEISYFNGAVSQTVLDTFENVKTSDFSYTDGKLTQIVSSGVGDDPQPSDDQTQTFSYDGDRLSQSTDFFSDEARTRIFNYTYDSLGRLTALDDDTVTTAFDYDAQGRVSSVGGVAVNYGANGLISDFATEHYEYEEGSVVGYVETPDFVGGFLFSLEGKPLDVQKALVSSSL